MDEILLTDRHFIKNSALNKSHYLMLYNFKNLDSRYFQKFVIIVLYNVVIINIKQKIKIST